MRWCRSKIDLGVVCLVYRFLRRCVDAGLRLALRFKVALPFVIDICVNTNMLTIDVVDEIVSNLRQRSSAESIVN